MQLNVARTLSRSAANGPGERFVVWVQGCPLACTGCWNPDTWSFARRDVRDVADLVAEITATPGIEGVTFTGGEPFAQARALAEVGRAVQRAGLSVFTWTGYDFDELVWGAARDLVSLTDVLVTGHFQHELATFALPWRGSSNQRVHFLTDRYGPADMADAVPVEVLVGPDGALKVTGFPPPSLLNCGFPDLGTPE